MIIFKDENGTVDIKVNYFDNVVSVLRYLVCILKEIEIQYDIRYFFLKKKLRNIES